jgi:hypothetical protein
MPRVRPFGTSTSTPSTAAISPVMLPNTVRKPSIRSDGGVCFMLGSGTDRLQDQ